MGFFLFKNNIINFFNLHIIAIRHILFPPSHLSKLPNFYLYLVVVPELGFEIQLDCCFIFESNWIKLYHPIYLKSYKFIINCWFYFHWSLEGHFCLCSSQIHSEVDSCQDQVLIYLTHTLTSIWRRYTGTLSKLTAFCTLQPREKVFTLRRELSFWCVICPRTWNFPVLNFQFLLFIKPAGRFIGESRAKNLACLVKCGNKLIYIKEKLTCSRTRYVNLLSVISFSLSFYARIYCAFRGTWLISSRSWIVIFLY